MNKSNLILIGLPASGKSTCGVLAAKALLKNFFDTDLLLQGLQEKSLQHILDDNGADYFIHAEEEAVCSLNLEATVIATGGSVIYSDKAMRHLQSMGTVIYLHLDYDTMCRRIHNLTTRGVVMQHGESLHDMYTERLPLYEKYADITLDCSKNDIEQTVKMIIETQETV